MTLEAKIKTLEKQLAEATKNETMLRSIFLSARDEITFFDTNGIIIDVNNKTGNAFGYYHTRQELIGRRIDSFSGIGEQYLLETRKRMEAGILDEPAKFYEVESRKKDGTAVFAEITVGAVRFNNDIIGYVSILRDITKRKQMEKRLSEYSEQLEDLVEERTNDLKKANTALQESNTALKVLLKQRDTDKSELEEQILNNVKKLILPDIEELKKSKDSGRHKDTIALIESNLNNIISPFSKRLSSKFYNLTQRELQIANLIKHGKTTKEIAGHINMSLNTVHFHRANIRRKLNINKTGSNLRSYLTNIEG